MISVVERLPNVQSPGLDPPELPQTKKHRLAESKTPAPNPMHNLVRMKAELLSMTLRTTPESHGSVG